LLLATFVGGSESSRCGTFTPWNFHTRVQKFQGAKVPHLELLLPGANGLGSEKSIIPFSVPGYPGLDPSGPTPTVT